MFLPRPQVPFLTAAFLLTASIAHAQTTGGFAACSSASDLGQFFIACGVGFINEILVPVVFSIAFIVLLWGVYTTFIAGGANEEKRQEGQRLLLYGIIGLFVMLSIWGFVNILMNTFGFGGDQAPALPQFQGSGQIQGGGGTNTFGGGDGNDTLGN